jgi:predicted P-loop ATPase
MIWEEVDSLTKREVNNLKTLISLSSYSGRVLYSEQQSTKPRTSTLWATVNPRDFLGSTDKRWIVHPVTDINFGYTDDVDFLDMWRQCYAMWKENHNAGELTKEELESHEVTAAEHINYSPLEEELMTIFSPDEKRNEFNVMSVNQIIKVLQPNLDTIQRGQQTQVGFAVSKIFGGYKYPKSRYRNNKGTFYYLIKK